MRTRLLKNLWALSASNYLKSGLSGDLPLTEHSAIFESILLFLKAFCYS